MALAFTGFLPKVKHIHCSTAIHCISVDNIIKAAEFIILYFIPITIHIDAMTNLQSILSVNMNV